MRPTILALLLSLWWLGAPAAAQEVSNDRLGTVGGMIQVSPTWLRLPTGERFDSPNAIPRALEFAAPGAVVELLPGTYPPFKIGFGNHDPENSRTVGGQPGLPIVIRGRQGVRVEHRDRADTLGISHTVPVAHIHFENIEFVPGYRSAIMFYDLEDTQAHVGFHFYDCRIVGRWDHPTKTGETSKWGVLGHDLSDFVFAGRNGRAVVRDIRLEHGFYLQSPRGNITLENIDASRLGRCFVQITARERSGPPGRGLVTIRNNHVNDTGISDWDNFKGGSAFTIAGGLEYCTILVEGNRYRAGFDPKLVHLTGEGAAYGTGALVAWDGGEARPNGNLLLRGNDFEIEKSAGDRPLVKIGACERVSVEADNRFVTGAWPTALEIQAVYDEQRSGPRQIGQLFLDAALEIQGQIRVDTELLTDKQRARYAIPLGDR